MDKIESDLHDKKRKQLITKIFRNKTDFVKFVRNKNKMMERTIDDLNDSNDLEEEEANFQGCIELNTIPTHSNNINDTAYNHVTTTPNGETDTEDEVP